MIGLCLGSNQALQCFQFCEILLYVFLLWVLCYIWFTFSSKIKEDKSLYLEAEFIGSIAGSKANKKSN